jgi:hypothetical protein
MKNVMKLLGIIALAAVIGFSFTACNDSAGDNSSGSDTTGGNSTGSNELPASVGDNQVGGKIYYQGNWEKSVFDASTGTNGEYTVYRVLYDDATNDLILDENGKYKWVINRTGTYTWNKNEKTITIRAEKILVDPPLSNNEKFMTKTEYKTAFTAYMIQFKDDTTLKQQLADMGYSSLTQYIDAMVNQEFDNYSYTYSFSNDGKSLFMQEILPQPKGTDDFVGKTYNGLMWDEEARKYEKDSYEEYVFGANKTYTHTYKDNGTVIETGTYYYDSTKKLVYFSIIKIDNKTAVEYYNSIKIWGDNYFIDEDAYKAAETNIQFRNYYFNYDPTQKLIGWFR